MTTLNGVKIPEFKNHDHLVDFMDQHKDKLVLSFLEDDGKIERNAILSLIESQNTEFNEVNTYHCLRCYSMDETIQSDGYCPDCDGDEDDY